MGLKGWPEFGETTRSWREFWGGEQSECRKADVRTGAGLGEAQVS